jgi:hypothetical protein
MPTGLEKTKNIIRRDIPPLLLEVHELNPNKMSKREFDLLVDNIQRVGLTDPVLVCPKDLEGFLVFWEKAKSLSDTDFIRALEEEDLRFKIIGGHHRLEAAKYLGFPAVPCTIITDADFDSEQQDFQLLRHNIIKGKIDPASFVALYEKYSSIYGDEALQDMFGFADEAEFKALLKETRKSIPKEMQKAFDDATKEIKTVDELARVLNNLYSRFGDTLPYGYMIIDYGGKQSIWLRVEKETFDKIVDLGTKCILHDRTMDAIMGKMLQLIAQAPHNKVFFEAVADTPPAKLPIDFKGVPTKDNLAKKES